MSDIVLCTPFQKVDVTIRKPSALPFADASGVKITRSLRPKIDSSQGKEVYIALGSNLGDRIWNLEEALRHLKNRGVEVEDVSGLYESEPMYVQEQPEFLNAVCKVRQEIYVTNRRLE